MMRMIKMTRNITRFKITSDLQIKHGLASNKKRYIRTTTPGSQGQNIPIYGPIFESYKYILVFKRYNFVFSK